MFTGIIEETGTIRRISTGSDKRIFTIQAQRVLEGTKKGDSISVNGVCLTVSSFYGNTFTADVMNVTVKATNYGDLKIGDKVNLERALAFGDRMGGHIVSGHVDCKGKIKEKKKDGNSVLVKVEHGDEYSSNVIPKGSVAVDGISLTVMECGDGWFLLSLIPTTRGDTTLMSKKTGDTVNLEFDVLGKYRNEHKEKKISKKSRITMEFLSENGF